jgi:hypothetical protein
MNNILIGKLYPHCESGTEGVVWAFSEDGKHGWDAFNLVNDGDFLQILNDDNSIIWEGNINYQHDRYHHGIQESFSKDAWFDLFLNQHKAKLVKSELGKLCFGGINSSIILAFSYENNNLYIKFKNNEYYKYENVPRNIYEEFYNATSMGSYFHKNIKKNFKMEKVKLPVL